MLTYKVFILVMMVALHILEDFHLQGILASMKQKSWWKKECGKLGIDFDSSKYKNDYIVALVAHSLENSIFVMLPVIIDNLVTTITVNPYNSFYILWAVTIILNTVAHAVIDNQKCNKNSINLVSDQIKHLLLILFCYEISWKYLGLWM